MSVWRARGLSAEQVGAQFHPGYAAGTWFGLRGVAANQAYTYAADILYAAPVWIMRTVRIDRLSISCSTGVASVLARLGLYASAGRAPGARLGETAAIDMSTAGGKEADLAAPVTLAPGIVWFAALFNGAAQAHGFSNNGTGSEPIMDILGWPSSTGIASSAGAGRFARATAAAPYAGGMPAVFGAAAFGTGSVGAPIIMARVA